MDLMNINKLNIKEKEKIYNTTIYCLNLLL